MRNLALFLIGVILALITIMGLNSLPCQAQSSYSDYQQSTQEINRQYHQLEVIRQNQLSNQQQYLQQQQLDQTRRNAESNSRGYNLGIDTQQQHYNPFRF